MHDAVWIEGQELLDEGILLSRHMMIDHLPDISYKSLMNTYKRLKGNSASAEAAST